MNKRTESNRSRAFIIAVVGSLTLFALAATVFAVAIQARSVTRQAEQAVQTIENFRVVSIARAELSIASRVSFSGVERTENQTDVLTSSVTAAEEALDAVEENFDESTSEDVRRDFALYRAASADQSELILEGTATAAEATLAEQNTGEAFDALSETLRSEQVDALDGLSADNDLMNVISTIATFIVAFVVPSAALYIFEALRRTPRRARQIEREFEAISATSKAMSVAVAAEADNLRSVARSLPPHVNRAEIQRSVLRFEHVAALNGAVRSLHNEDVDVAALCSKILTTINSPVAFDARTSESSVIHSDQEQITLIVSELLYNATTHGSEPVRLEIFTDEDSVTISVIDYGAGLPDIVEDSVIHDNEFATRGNLLSGTYGFGLLAAREATEALGGQLRYHRDEGETSMTVELPRGHHAQASLGLGLPAALEGRAAA